MPTHRKAKEDFEKLATLKKEAELRVVGQCLEPFPCSLQDVEAFVLKAKNSHSTLQSLSGFGTPA